MMIEDTLRRYPLIGAGTSVVGPVANMLDTLGIILGLIGACIGIGIGIYTFKIKKMEYDNKRGKK